MRFACDSGPTCSIHHHRLKNTGLCVCGLGGDSVLGGLLKSTTTTMATTTASSLFSANTPSFMPGTLFTIFMTFIAALERVYSIIGIPILTFPTAILAGGQQQEYGDILLHNVAYMKLVYACLMSINIYYIVMLHVCYLNSVCICLNIRTVYSFIIYFIKYLQFDYGRMVHLNLQFSYYLHLVKLLLCYLT